MLLNDLNALKGVHVKYRGAQSMKKKPPCAGAEALAQALNLSVLSAFVVNSEKLTAGCGI